jgi:hypothetical protein
VSRKRRPSATVEKKPVAAIKPVGGKRPSAARGPGVHPDFPAWRFARAELTGPWGWSEISGDKALEVYTKLVHHEERTWAESLKPKSAGYKRIPVESVCAKAQRRLEDRNLDDYDDLVEFRLSGQERVWGIREGNICYILWWDPKHEVCPSHMKHT